MQDTYTDHLGSGPLYKVMFRGIAIAYFLAEMDAAAFAADKAYKHSKLVERESKHVFRIRGRDPQPVSNKSWNP